MPTHSARISPASKKAVQIGALLTPIQMAKSLPKFNPSLPIAFVCLSLFSASLRFPVVPLLPQAKKNTLQGTEVAELLLHG
ncbi:hypothetical protein Ddc_10902 [Ditylenchus destructor]|nr:hypothetical protein Ddc_10902 [Ditylenchus destructor]